MKNNKIVIDSAEPFYFPGNDIGCLLVHGFTGTPKEMRLLGEYLAEQSYSVLGIRLAGHATKLTDMIRTRHQDWIASVEDGINLLRNNVKHLYVIGLSMGGVLSLIAGSNYDIDGIAAISTPYSLPDDWRLKYIKLFHFLFPEISKGESDWHDKKLSKDHVSYSKYPTRSIAELKTLIDIMQSSLSEVYVPTLLIQSEKDNTISANALNNIYDNLGTSDKDSFWVKNSGHVITREPDKDLVFKRINSFINKTNGN